MPLFGTRRTNHQQLLSPVFIQTIYFFQSILTAIVKTDHYRSPIKTINRLRSCYQLALITLESFASLLIGVLTTQCAVCLPVANVCLQKNWHHRQQLGAFCCSMWLSGTAHCSVALIASVRARLLEGWCETEMSHVNCMSWNSICSTAQTCALSLFLLKSTYTTFIDMPLSAYRGISAANSWRSSTSALLIFASTGVCRWNPWNWSTLRWRRRSNWNPELKLKRA